MANNHAFLVPAAPLPSMGAGQTTTAALGRRIVATLLPARREGRAVLMVGAVIVLFIVAFTNLMLGEIRDSARASAQAHVEQLAKAVSYQFGTTLFMVENALNQASEEILAHRDTRSLARLDSRNQVAGKLLTDFFFINPAGHVVSAMAQAETLGDLSDREYFRTHLAGHSPESRISRPILGRLNGTKLIPVSRSVRRPDGSLVGVLVAIIDVEALDRIWKTIGLQPDDTIELIGEDDSVWLLWPHRPVAENAGDVSWSYHVANSPMRIVAKLDLATVDRQTLPARRAIVGAAVIGAVMVALFAFLLARRARQAAREHDAAAAAQARLTAALNAVPVEFVEYDRDRRLVMANQAARDASPWRVPGAARGKTVDEVMQSYADHFQTADNADAWKVWTRQTIADYDRGGVAESCRPDGQWRRSYVSDMPSGGRVVVRVDVTEEKRREKQLEAEMARFHSLVQSTGASIVMLDREGRVVLVNQPVLDDFGKTAAEVIGRSYSELGIKAVGPVISDWQAACGPQRLKTLEYERKIVRTNGVQRILKVTADPIQDEAGRLLYIVLIAVDDTERRLAEIQLFDSARIGHLGSMATGMAHELNQPLAVIRMATDTLIEELETPEGEAMPSELAQLFRKKLERIGQQVERASGLIRTLRDVVRKPASDPAPFDLVAAVRKGADLLGEQLRVARIDFNLDLPASGPMVRGDANQVQQVLISLVLNARDALTYDTGRPTAGTLGHITVRMAPAANGGMELTVEDDGPGIPPEVMARLFEPFFTTKPTGKGTGLGLSISHGVIERMGGEINAENRPQGGACFRIAFPAS